MLHNKELLILSVMILCDIITGIATAVFGKSVKTESGTLKSRILRNGGFEKFGILFLIVCIDILMQYFKQDYIAISCYIFYITTEMYSVIENCATLGFKIPSKIIEFITKKGGENKNED